MTLRYWLTAALLLSSVNASAIVNPATGSQSIPLTISGSVGSLATGSESCGITGAAVNLRFNNDFVTTAPNALKVTCQNTQGLVEASARLSTTPTGVCSSIPTLVGPTPGRTTTLTDYTLSRIDLAAATSGSYQPLERFNAGSTQNNDKSVSIQARIVASQGGNPAPGQIFVYDAITGEELPTGSPTNLYLFYGDTYVDDTADNANCSAVPVRAPQAS